MKPLFSSRTRPLSLLCAVAVAGLTGCGEKPAAPAPAPAPAASALPEPPLVAACEPGIPGGRMVIATFGDPKTFNPVTENESSSSAIIRFLFAGLTDLDWPSQTAKPALAHSWKAEPDGKTWTFTLRRGLRWSDGHPLTADDVVFTFNDCIYNTNFPNANADALKIDGKPFLVSKVDDLTVRVVTPAPYAPFAEYFGGVAILPKHKLAHTIADKSFQSAYGINTKPEELVGSGPFKLKQFKGGQLTLLERNPHFFAVDKQGQRLPYFDHVVHTVVPDMNAMSLSFLKGESDVHETVRPDEYERFKAEAAKGAFTLQDLGVGPERGFLWFNLNPGTNKTGKPFVDAKKLKWFQEAKFRQAVAHAVDRPSIIKAIYAGRAQVNYGFVSTCLTKWHNPNTPQYPHNLPKAWSLLQEIGIADRNADGLLEDAQGNAIEFTLHTNTGNNVRDRIAVFLQEDLKRLGFKVNYQPLEFNLMVSKINETYDYDAMLLGLGGGGADPAASMNVLKSDGFTHFWFPKQARPATPWEARIDELMNLQVQNLDEKKRKELYDEVQAILGREMPFIYTVSPFSYAAAKPGLGNMRPTVLSSYRLTWNAEELYWKKK